MTREWSVYSSTKALSGHECTLCLHTAAAAACQAAESVERGIRHAKKNLVVVDRYKVFTGLSTREAGVRLRACVSRG